MMQTPKATAWMNLDKVYTCVCEDPGKSTNEMCEELDMHNEHLNEILDQLQSVGLVQFKMARLSPIVKKIYPVEKTFLMNAKMKKELKKFMLNK